LNTVLIPTESGSYRWYYVDVTDGEYTCVAIFMLGGLFSARYAKACAQGGRPAEYSAVNCALYRNGLRQAWALSEYPTAHTENDQRRLCIGKSWFEYTPLGCDIVIDDQTTPFLLTSSGRPLSVRMSLQFQSPPAEELQLFENEPHFWQPRAALAKAQVEVLSSNEKFSGRAYHDLNHGAELLGRRVTGWEWMRNHREGETTVSYRPDGQAHCIEVRASAEGVSTQRVSADLPLRRRTKWGLSVPSRLADKPGALLESSPFYARLEAAQDGELVLGEVADFRRFHRSSVRWMAGFKTRVGSAA
jgi:carotenoid 1,2-hydratase